MQVAFIKMTFANGIVAEYQTEITLDEGQDKPSDDDIENLAELFSGYNKGMELPYFKFNTIHNKTIRLNFKATPVMVVEVYTEKV